MNIFLDLVNPWMVKENKLWIVFRAFQDLFFEN